MDVRRAALCAALGACVAVLIGYFAWAPTFASNPYFHGGMLDWLNYHFNDWSVWALFGAAIGAIVSMLKGPNPMRLNGEPAATRNEHRERDRGTDADLSIQLKQMRVRGRPLSFWRSSGNTRRHLYATGAGAARQNRCGDRSG
jgi:hypothetical protein